MMFADVVGYSKLTEEEIPLFGRLPLVGKLFQNLGFNITNTLKLQMKKHM